MSATKRLDPKVLFLVNVQSYPKVISSTKDGLPSYLQYDRVAFKILGRPMSFQKKKNVYAARATRASVVEIN